MEILNIRLDSMDAMNSSNGALKGAKSTLQGESSFSMVLDKALKSADGAQDRTKTQTEPTQKAVSNDTTTPDRVTGEKTERPEDTVQKPIEKGNEEKVAKTEETEKEDGAVTKAEDEENAVAFTDELDALLSRVIGDSEKQTAKVTEDADIGVNEQEHATFVQNISLFGDDAAEDALVKADADEAGSVTATGKPKRTVEESENVALFVGHEDSSVQASIVAVAEDETGAVQKTGRAAKGEKPLFTVIDERSVNENGTENGEEIAGGVRAVGSAQTATDANTTQMELSLGDGAKTAFTASADAATNASGNDSAFASMLSSEIKSNAGEFVKNGMITLKDNNRGTINLVLHPEELGNVKIKLELSDKLITGRIIVASEEAYGAFKENIETLRQAFLAQGFDGAGFELSLAGGNGGEEQNGQKQSEKNPRGFMYEESLPLAAGGEDMSTNALYGVTKVNVVV